MSKFLSSFLGWPSAEKDDLTQPQLNEDATLGRGDVEGVVSQLETQMTSSPVMVQLPPPDLPQPRSFNSAYEAAALAVSAPTTGLSIHRLRSLSKAFTALPAKPLPTYPQMAMDQVEYLMHVLLLETNPARAYKHQRNIEAAFSTFVNCDPSAKDCLTSGRLYSRTQVTALACDIIVLRLDDDVVTPDCDDDIPLASNLSSDHWNSIQEQIIFVKGILLRQNANAVVTWESGGAIPAPVPDSDLPDDQLAKHLMMTVDYEEVVRLLSVQQELASLREQLLATADLENQSESSNTNLTGKSPHNYERIVNKAVEKAVNQYMENLSRIFPPVDISTEEDDEIDDGFVLDEGSDTDSMPATRISNVPQELNSFVLTDLYRSKQQRQRTTATDMVNRLLKHVQSITTDTKTPALTQSGIFSYANLQQKVRHTKKWSSAVGNIAQF